MVTLERAHPTLDHIERMVRRRASEARYPGPQQQVGILDGVGYGCRRPVEVSVFAELICPAPITVCALPFCPAAGSSTIRHGNPVSERTWARTSPSADSISRPSSVRSAIIVPVSPS